MNRYLIVNSDDFGISDGVNRGIVEAHLHGIVSSTSVMAHMPAADAGIRYAQAEAPTLGLGLHLTLSFGTPVSDPARIPSLVTSEGTFVSTFAELSQKMTSFSATDLEIELRAQFERFVLLAGRKPDHLDSHHHSTYYQPDAFEVMCQLAAEHDLPIRRPTWLDGPAFDHMPTNADGRLVERLRESYERHGKPRTTDAMLDPIFRWERGSRVEALRQALEGIHPGYTEIICHVGYAEDLQEIFNIQREDELEALTDPSILACLPILGIREVTFANLPR